MIVQWYSDYMKDRKKSKTAMLSSAQRYASNVSIGRDVRQAGAICYRRRLRELLRKFADAIGGSGTTDGPGFQLGRGFKSLICIFRIVKAIASSP